MTADPRTPWPDRTAAAYDAQHCDVLEAIDVVVFRTDAGGRWTSVNRAWTDLTGAPVEATLATSFLDSVCGDDREQVAARFAALAASASDHWAHRARYLTADGSCRWLEVRAHAVRDDDGALTGTVGTIIDVSDDVLAQQAISEYRHVLEVLSTEGDAADVSVGVVLYDPRLSVRRASPTAARLLGPAVEVGRPLAHLGEALEPSSAGPSLHAEWGLVARARRLDRPQYAEMRTTESGASGRSTFQVAVIPAADGGAAVALHDVTRLDRARRQQAAVARVGQLALRGRDVGRLLEEAVNIVAEALEVASCGVLELAPRERVLLARAAVGWPGGVHAVGPVALDARSEPLARALDEEEPVVVERAPTDAGWLAGAATTAAVGIGGTGPTVAGATGARGGRFGVLAVQSRLPRRFTRDETDFLAAVASVLATAIERARDDQQVRYRALHDPLTGLANRALLHDHLEQALAARHRTERRVALLLMDLDRFKEINDTLGHSVGDEVLRLVAGRLREASRAGDTVARLGGDEFAIVLPDVATVDDAVRAAEKIRVAVGRVLEIADLALHVGGSIGLALAPDSGDGVFPLLQRADVAMYRAKHLPHGVSVYSRETDSSADEQFVSSTALRHALDDDEIVLHFQPKLDLVERRTLGMEALARWEHPRRGLLAPGTFLHVAERTGLVAPLTRRVLRLALRQARTWRSQGHPQVVAVNVSARMLHGGELIASVVSELERAGLPPELLELEVPEGAVMASPAAAMGILHRLREIGVRLTVDDFGTGGSSLAHLRDLPVHQLKIDRSFVADLASSARSESMVRAIIELGHHLGLRIVAAGIETEQVLLRLRAMGCDEGQGFLLGPPMPAS